MIAALIFGMGALAVIGGLIWVANNSGKGPAVSRDTSGDSGILPGVVGSSSDSHHGHHHSHDANCNCGDSGGGDDSGGGGGDGGGGGGSD
jgi:hypothetical protein